MDGHRAPMGRRGALGAGAGALAAVLVAGCARSGGTGGGAGPEAATRPSGEAPAPSASATPAPAASRAAAPAPHRFPALPFRIAHGPRDRPRVALTFDGRGDPDLAHTALARCEQAGARVTVLAVGAWLAEHPGLARRILDGGHEIGNHTEHHLDLASLDERAAYEEIAACARRLRRLTGSIGAWFRPSPTAYASPLLQRLAQRAAIPTSSAATWSRSTTRPPASPPSPARSRGSCATGRWWSSASAARPPSTRCRCCSPRSAAAGCTR